MSSELFAIEYTSGLTIELRIWNTSGQVFDHSDNTFKALGSAVTTGLSMTEYSAMAGTGRSVYMATMNLSLLNSTSTVAQYALNAYSSGNPVGNIGTMNVADGAIIHRMSLVESIAREPSSYRSVSTKNPTMAQLLWEIWAAIMNFEVSGSEVLVKNVDGDQVITVTLDDADSPTSRERTS